MLATFQSPGVSSKLNELVNVPANFLVFLPTSLAHLDICLAMVFKTDHFNNPTSITDLKKQNHLFLLQKKTPDLFIEKASTVRALLLFCLYLIQLKSFCAPMRSLLAPLHSKSVVCE